MSLKSDYIKRKLWRFIFLVSALLIIEYVLLVRLNLSVLVQVLAQISIGVVLLSAIIKTSYQIWVMTEHTKNPPGEKPNQPAPQNGL